MQHFSQHEFRNILDEFTEATKRKEYNRVEYSLWRDITKYKLAKYSYNIYVDFQCNLGIAIEDCETNNSAVDYIVVPKGCGLHKFFFDKYLKNKEVKEDEVAKPIDPAFYSNAIDQLTVNNSSNNQIKPSAVNVCGSALNDAYTYSTSAGPLTYSNKTNYSYSDSTFSNSYSYYTKEEIDEKFKKLENKEEDKKMKGFNFNFGPCTNDNIRMSMYGLAVQNTNGEWVSYNNGDIVNVDIFNFDGRKFMFKMPCTFKDIKVGDILIHNKKPMFVEDIADVEGTVIVVDPMAGERKEIIPTKNMFGFNVYTKVVSMFDAFACAPTADQPFGNMLPFLMMEDNKDMDPMMLMMMMNGGKMDMNNPMLMYMMMKDGNHSDMLPLMFMMNNNK